MKDGGGIGHGGTRRSGGLAGRLAARRVGDRPQWACTRAGTAAAPPGALVAQAEPLRHTEADAVAAAKASGPAIEIGAFRSERRDVWANPDGTFTENTTRSRSGR